jgi:hypothetical protein
MAAGAAMKLSRNQILSLGAQSKAAMMSAYANCGTEDGHAIARCSLFDIAEAMADVHGREHAAATMYEIADAIATKLPLKDWQEHLAAPPAAVAPVPKVHWFRGAWDESKFVLGFFLGLWLGGAAR